MKSLLAALGAVVAGATLAQAQPLLSYDFNNLSSNDDPTIASFCAPCIDPTLLFPCDLTQSFYPAGGPDGTSFRGFSGWDQNPNFDLNRSGLWQWPNTVAFDFTFDAASAGTIGSLSLDFLRTSTGSPTSIQAAIFWADGFGDIQHRVSDAASLTSLQSWDSLTLDWDNGSAALPDGVGLAGEDFHVELYAWGGESELYIDNLTLDGACAPIPEPGSALLIGAAGLVLLLRHRRFKAV